MALEPPTTHMQTCFASSLRIALVSAGLLAVPAVQGCAANDRDDAITERTPDSTVADAARESKPLDWGDFGLILFHVCSPDGGVNVDALHENSALIDSTVKSLADVGPRSQPAAFPESDAKTAYYINASNLLMLAELSSVMGAGGQTSRRLSPSSAQRWRIDGGEETVFSLRNKAIAAAREDWRVRMALFSGRMDGPPLWNRVMLGDMLDVQLDEITWAAMKSPRVVRPDFSENKRLLVCEELFELKELLVEDYERRLGTSHATLLNVILEWLDGFDRESMNAVVGYPVELLPKDWSLPLAKN